MADPTELANTLFPPPPPFYKEFTTSNLARFAELRGEPSGTSKGKAGPELDEEDRVELQDLQGKLEKPRADWIVEEGRWMCFGQQYDVEPRIPTAEQIGLPRFIDPDEPPQTSLPPLLHSFLHTFLLLLDTLTTTARIPGELEEKGWAHEGDQYIQHLSNLAATMMVASNQLRDVQAEATLVMLMEKQLTTRRQQTAELQSKSKTIADMLVQLKQSALSASTGVPAENGVGMRDADGDEKMGATPAGDADHAAADLQS